MEDIAPALLEAIRSSFKTLLGDAAVTKKTYTGAAEYAERVGAALSGAFGSNLSSEVLPDGRMYWNIADRTVRPMLEQGHNLVADATAQVQQTMNEAAGIGLKAQAAPMNTERVDSILNKLSSAEQYDDAAWILDEPVKTFIRCAVDDTLRKNVDFQGNAGLLPRIIRTAESHCCKWCSKLEGTYRYPDVPDDIYRRHNRCRCSVEYDPGDGMRQDVWSKKWKEPSKTLEQRKDIVGVDTRAGIREVQTKNTDPKNVMPEYLRTATPGKGKITYEDGYDTHRHMPEIKTAQWLHDNLGGDIVLLNESKIQGQKTPDFIWRKQLWDLKTLSSEKAANSAVRHGLQQIRENPGGIILDFGNTPFSMTELEKTINKRMQWNQLEKADIIVIARGQII
ncbi:MAG: hypothetical protein RR825_06660, partial [Ruthenibacterium sp.]